MSFLIDVRFQKKIKFIFLSFLFFIAYINNKIILILIDYKYDISIQNILQYINQKRSVGSIQKYEQTGYNFNTYIFDLISYLFKPLNFDISNQFIFLKFSRKSSSFNFFYNNIIKNKRFKKMINIFEAKYTFFFIYFVFIVSNTFNYNN